MARIVPQNPGSGEVQSPLLAGITEALSGISGVLDLKVGKLVDAKLTPVSIDGQEKNKNRIFEASSGNRLWLSDPEPVIKKNGQVLKQVSAGYTIDYVGGSVSFSVGSKPSDSDTITVTCSYITATSQTVDSLESGLRAAQTQAGKYKGSYANLSGLQLSHPSASNGDFAIVYSPLAVFAWVDNVWKDTRSIADFSDYYNKSDVNNLLAKKEPIVKAHGASSNDDNFFWSGRKMWVDILAKIRGALLTGLSTASATTVTASDTILSAIGKLQAQISQYTSRAYKTGSGAPSASTAGTVGQRYVNTSNGDEYVCTHAGSGSYTWVLAPKSVNGKKPVAGGNITLTAADVNALGKAEKATDSAKLENHSASYFAKADDVETFSATFRHGSAWAKSGSSWIQTVTCTGMKAAYDTTDPWIKKTGVKSTDEAMQEAFNILNNGVVKTLDGQLQATVYEGPPVADFTIHIRRDTT